MKRVRDYLSAGVRIPRWRLWFFLLVTALVLIREANALLWWMWS
jgi:hypothetical protein